MTRATETSPSDDRSRLRLWVPGLLWVSCDGEVCVGPHVGYADDRPDAHPPGWALLRRIEEWTHCAWIVERAALRPALVREHAIIMPETLVDRDELPNAWRWLAEQRLVCVSGLKADRLADAGVRLHQIAYNTAADERFTLTIRGGGAPEVEFQAPLAALEAPDPTAARRPPALEKSAHASTVDRALLLLSDGVLSEAGVVSALAARSLVEDGYGYHGTPYGEYRSVDQIARDARGLDDLFGQVFRRARDQVDDARALERALPRGLVDAEEIAVPVYGRARRLTIDARTVPTKSTGNQAAIRLRVGDVPQASLELPAVDRWFVQDVLPWSPALSERLAEQLHEDHRDRMGAMVKLVALCVLAAVALVAAVLGWAWWE